ncbi:MAG: hypothetical protein ABGZ53_07625 [Fuerstiella sp.]
MKNLLRLSLFIIARTGLFLAAAMWIVGQSWTVCRIVCVSSHIMGIATDNECCVISHASQNAGDSPSFTIEPSRDRRASVAVNGAWAFHKVRSWKTARTPGTVVFLADGAQCVFLRHWLVVTFFAFFYGVLKWVYGPRGKAAQATVRV